MTAQQAAAARVIADLRGAQGDTDEEMTDILLAMELIAVAASMTGPNQQPARYMARYFAERRGIDADLIETQSMARIAERMQAVD